MATEYPVRVTDPNIPLIGRPPSKILESPDNNKATKYLGVPSASPKYLKTITLPFIDLENKKYSKSYKVHEKVANKFESWFEEMERTGVLSDIILPGGTFCYRPVRGKTTLSNHCWAIAIDFNVPWNGLGQPLAKPGQVGCLYRVAEIAFKHGFYWGGWYRSRTDGMHFEYADFSNMTPGTNENLHPTYVNGNEQNVIGNSSGYSSNNIRTDFSQLFLFGGGTGTQLADIDTPTEITAPITSGETKGTEGGIPVDRQQYELRQVVNPELNYKDNPNK